MTTQQDEPTRVRSYLLAQGDKYGYTEMWSRCAAARLELLGALQGVGEEQGTFVPAEGEWSIAEVALHILHSSRRVAQLVEHLAKGEAATSTMVDPPREGTDRSVGELRELLLRDALAWASLTQLLPDSPSFTAMSPHSVFGELHSRAWYLFQRVHDLDHYRQIQSIKATPSYPTSRS